MGWESESLLAGPGPSPSSGTCQGGGTGRAAGHALLLHNECQPLAVRQQAATHVKACWRAAKAGPDRPVAAGESHANSPAAQRGRGPSHPLKTGSAPPHCPRARVGRRPLWTRTLGAEVPRRRAQRMNSAPAEQPGDRSPKQLSKRARHGRPPRLPRGRGKRENQQSWSRQFKSRRNSTLQADGREGRPTPPARPSGRSETATEKAEAQENQ